MNRAHSIISGWLEQHPSSFPPIIINITDGESTDGDQTNAAEGKKISFINDGNVLLFNLHLSSNKAAPVEFPDSEIGLPDEYSQLLFRISSQLPYYMRSIAEQEGIRVSEGVFNTLLASDYVSSLTLS